MIAEQQPHLLPLPLEPFRDYQYGERVVHLDGCVEVEAAYYSLPPGWIGRPVKVQWDELHVRVLHPHTNQLLREHLHQKRGGYRIQEEDRSEEHTSELQSHSDLVCRLLLEKKNIYFWQSNVSDTTL